LQYSLLNQPFDIGRIAMTKWEKFKFRTYVYFRYKFPESLRNVRRRIWNAGIKLFWHRLFVRKNEFHSSLDMDIEAIMVMGKKRLEKYRNDIARRRWIAHKRDLAKEDEFRTEKGE